MRVLGLIPARGASKGIARKNIRPLNGRPLLEYTADVALACSRLEPVVLSTDDAEIAEVGRRAGLSVPWLRPAHLAQDDTPMLAVVQHAVGVVELAMGQTFDAICLLQPTHPMRRLADVEACLDLLVSSDADSVMTILAVPAAFNPHWVYWRDSDGVLRLSTGAASPVPRRQELPPAFCREGSVYLTRRSVVMGQHSLYGNSTIGHLVDASRSVNIDAPDDWLRAQQLVAAPTGAIHQ